MREFLVSALPFLTTLLITVLGTVATRLALVLRSKGVSESVVSALNAVSSAAQLVVRNAEQTVVADLKDPHKPGLWTSDLAKAIGAGARRDVHTFAAAALNELRKQGMSEDKVEELVSQAVESAVTELHRAK